MANCSWKLLTPSPHIAPEDAMIAPDLCGWRVPATESIAVASG